MNASEAHRRLLVHELTKGFVTIGPNYEAFGGILVDYISRQPMVHRGLNTAGLPVGHTLDSVSTNGEVVAEYSAEKGYFKSPFKKIRNDLRHCRELHSQANDILLLSNQECGPEAHTRIVNLQSRFKKWLRKELSVFDARKQAGFIVDNLLLNDTAVDRLAAYLAPLERVRAEYAATRLVPPQRAGYLSRPSLESQVLKGLQTDRVVGLAGMSGTGKSQVAVAVAGRVADQFDLVIWASASAITATTDLHGVEIERRSYRVNLVHILRERACLVVLDDLRAALPLAELKLCCGDRSAILITRQSAYDDDIRIPLLSRGEARSVLEHEVQAACPDDVFDLAWDAVGGHPLALSLMNAAVRRGSWEQLRDDCAAVGQYLDEDRLQRLVDRLLGRLKQPLEKELAFFAWGGSARVDRSFARRAIFSIGLQKLDDACLLAADRNDVIRLHDIAHTALASLQLPVQLYAAEFDAALDAHVEELAFGGSNALGFLNFCQVHFEQIARLLQADSKRSACLFCLAHAWSDDAVTLALVGDPIVRTQEIVAAGAPRDIDISAICEAIEALYRKSKREVGTAGARTALETYLEVFKSLEGCSAVSGRARRTILHHHAKALRNLQRYAEAIAICESILSEHDNPATKLLLARLLIFEKASVERAKCLLFELLENARTSPGTAEISVTLAAIETIGRWQLKPWFREALSKYGELVAGFIIESATRGFDQSFVAFASIGRELRYNNPDLYLTVFRQLPKQTPEDARDDKERAALGDILLAASEVPEINQLKQLASEALQFYEALEKPDAYNLQQKGHALILLERFEDARNVLEKAVADKATPWSKYWLSKAMLGLKDFQTALALIDEAIADPKAKAYQAAMTEHRWEVRKAAGEPNAIDDLEKAHDLCVDEKHTAALAKKLTIERGAQK